jgi:long-subunit fatty acid transport protein
VIFSILLSSFFDIYASPIDIFGFDATNGAMGNTGTASVGMGALSMNPAGIHGKRSLLFGYSFLRTNFLDVSSVAWDSNQDGTINELDERLQPDVNYAPIDGMSFGIVQPMMKGVTFGLNAYFPSARLLRLNTYDSALPSYFLYRSSLQRYGLLGGINLEVFKGVRVGIGVDLLYTARFVLTGTLRGSFSSSSEEGEAPDIEAVVDLHETSLEASPAGAYIFGVQWDIPSVEGLRIGAAYRTAHANPMEVVLDLQVDGSLTGIEDFNDQSVSIVAPISLSLLDYYKPSEFRLGAAWERWGKAQIFGDILWTGWSKAFLNTMQVSEGSLLIPVLYEDPISVVDGNPYDLILKDVWSFRLGIASEWSLWEKEIVIRGGVGYTTSALARYGRNMTPLEAPRFLLSSGGTVHMISPFLQKPMSVSFFGQWQKLASGYVEVAYDTPNTLGAPEGDQVSFGGSLLGMGIQTNVHY